MINKKIFALLLFTFFVSCGDRSQTASIPTTETGQTENQNPDTEREHETDLKRALELRLKASSILLPWRDEYSEAIIEEFSKESFNTLFTMSIKSNDLERLKCTGFSKANNVDKMKFYLTLLASIAEAESDFKNTSRSIAPNGTTNIGLFQMDVKAANVHTKNEFGVLTDSDLSEGVTNSRVGAHVLKNQLTRKGPVIFRGDYYWEVLNPNRGGINHVLRYFHQHLDQLEFCP